MFTAQDFDHQRFSVHALQEALGASNETVDKYKKKSAELDKDLSTARRTVREQEATIRGLVTENSTLKDDKVLLQHQLAELRNDYDDLSQENFDLRQQSLGPADSDYMMTSGSGESLNNLERSRSKRHHSKHGNKNMTDRLKERINKGNPESEASSSKSRKDPEKKKEHRRSESKTRRSYEEPPADRQLRDKTRPPVTTRAYEGNYTTTSGIGSPISSRLSSSIMAPRSSQATTSIYKPTQTTGDYFPQPLSPEKHHSERGRRHH